jgi:hypothetical protein
MSMRDVGEPISSGRRDLRDAERRALGSALFAAVFFTTAVLINGILAILLIEFLQSIGAWEVTMPALPGEISPEFASRLRSPRPEPTMA